MTFKQKERITGKQSQDLFLLTRYDNIWTNGNCQMINVYKSRPIIYFDFVIQIDFFHLENSPEIKRYVYFIDEQLIILTLLLEIRLVLVLGYS